MWACCGVDDAEKFKMLWTRSNFQRLAETSPCRPVPLQACIVLQGSWVTGSRRGARLGPRLPIFIYSVHLSVVLLVLDPV